MKDFYDETMPWMWLLLPESTLLPRTELGTGHEES
jgi:hypothetical protein